MHLTKEATAELQAMYDQHGQLKPSWVVKKSKSKNSALHPYIDWDDASAANAHRLDQARRIIRVVRVTTAERTEPQRVIHVPRCKAEKKGEGSYRVAAEIVRDKDAFARALEEASRRLAAAQFAVQQLRNAAKGSQDTDLAKISIAIESLATAREAMHSLH